MNNSGNEEVYISFELKPVQKDIKFFSCQHNTADMTTLAISSVVPIRCHCDKNAVSIAFGMKLKRIVRSVTPVDNGQEFTEAKPVKHGVHNYRINLWYRLNNLDIFSNRYIATTRMRLRIVE